MGRMKQLLEFLKTERGRATLLAKRLGISPGAVSQWKTVPIEHLAEVSDFTGIPRDVLCPDAFRPAKAGEAA